MQDHVHAGQRPSSQIVFLSVDADPARRFVVPHAGKYTVR
jgi:hypothetical protein